jgi:hypothetical protein
MQFDPDKFFTVTNGFALIVIWSVVFQAGYFSVVGLEYMSLLSTADIVFSIGLTLPFFFIGQGLVFYSQNRWHPMLKKETGFKM